MTAFAEHYNNRRLQRSIHYLAPADKLAGREKILPRPRDQRLEAARERRGMRHMELHRPPESPDGLRHAASVAVNVVAESAQLYPQLWSFHTEMWAIRARVECAKISELKTVMREHFDTIVKRLPQMVAARGELRAAEVGAVVPNGQDRARRRTAQGRPSASTATGCRGRGPLAVPLAGQ